MEWKECLIIIMIYNNIIVLFYCLSGNSRWDGKSDLILFDILTLFKKSNHFPDKSNWVAEGRLYSDARARWLYQAKIDSNRPFGIMKMAPDIGKS